MKAIDVSGAASTVVDGFARLLVQHKSDIGMDDIEDAELLREVPRILGALVRISLKALRDADDPDNACRLAALCWFVDWAEKNIDGFPDAALEGDTALGLDLAVATHVKQDWMGLALRVRKPNA